MGSIDGHQRSCIKPTLFHREVEIGREKVTVFGPVLRFSVPSKAQFIERSMVFLAKVTVFGPVLLMRRGMVSANKYCHLSRLA